MRKLLIISALALSWGSNVRAQTLGKQLEVTRAYVPKIEAAEKLAIQPQVVDTVRMRPEIAYRITSIASQTSFVVRPYEAATIGFGPGATEKPLYIKAGVGWPIVTDFDLYVTSATKNNFRFGGFLNHDGSFSKIRNDLNVKVNATEMSNAGGAWLTKRWGRKRLEADATFDNRIYNPYGTSGSGAVSRQMAVTQRFMEQFSLSFARLGISWGDDFSNLRRLNWRVAVDAGRAVAHGRGQTNFDAKLTAAKMFGRHGMQVNVETDGAWATGENVNTIGFLPRYIFVYQDFSLTAGVDVRHLRNEMAGQNGLRLAPMFEARLDIAGGALVPFVSYRSEVLSGDVEALSRRNPYVTTGGPTAWINHGRAGAMGDLNDVVSYEISGGMSLFTDYQLFTGAPLVSRRDATGISYPAMWFAPLAVDGVRWTAGAEISVQNLGGFGAKIYGNWNKFSFHGYDSGFTPVGDLPRYDAGIKLSWSWRGVFSVNTGAEFIGERDYLVRNGLASLYRRSVIPPKLDITFGLQTRVKQGLWIFVEGENLANQKLYPYPHYSGLGTSVVAGVKLTL